MKKEDLLLYAVTDGSRDGKKSVAEKVKEAIIGGATFVQYREKHLPYEEKLSEATEIKKVCEKYGVPFVINDDVRLAVECGADGVHVGQSDTEAGSAHRLIGKDKILGVSAASVSEALAAEKAGADYIGVGAMFPTDTKKDAKDVSFYELRRICNAVKVPVVAIGGINRGNVLDLKGSGASGIAVISALFGEGDIAENAGYLKRLSYEMTVGERKSEHRLRGAIFDFDGTLGATMGIWEPVGDMYLKSLGIVPEPGLRDITRPMCHMEVAEYFRDRYGVKLSNEEIRAGINDIVREMYKTEVKLKDGAEEFIKYLHANGVKMCIATATEKTIIEACVKALGIDEYFEFVESCYELATGKTTSQLYDESMKRLGTEKSETVVFEDALHAIKTCKKAGYFVAGVQDDLEEKNASQIKRFSDVYLTDLSKGEKIW